eukprot:2909725-Rhodomonas_salina.2
MVLRMCYAFSGTDVGCAAIRLQEEAQVLAELFNRRLGEMEGKVKTNTNVAIPMVVEDELTGKFTKWNNNAGAVSRATPNRHLGAITEEDEEEDEDGDGRDRSNVYLQARCRGTDLASVLVPGDCGSLARAAVLLALHAHGHRGDSAIAYASPLPFQCSAIAYACPFFLRY